MRSVSLVFLLATCAASLAQSSHHYLVTFTDKDGGNYSLDRPLEFLSQRSIDRRSVQGIELSQADLPISSAYMLEISKLSSVQILSSSKWFNDVLVSVADTSVIAKLGSESYIKSVEALPGLHGKRGGQSSKLLDTTYYRASQPAEDQGYGSAYWQAAMLNCHYLHARGFRGSGKRIALIDAGFSWAWSSVHFKEMYSGGRMIDSYDFIARKKDVYEHSIHGTYVLSTMAANTPDSMSGTAPGAEYILLRSEDGDSEYLLEEYYWTQAAEFADSAGADIINTSLGYSLFDDSLENHSYADMDGKSTRISRSAEAAFSKGILLFNSAGHSGNNSWGKITAPSDAVSVIAVGAVDSSLTCADFSSRGPSSDGRVKPDVMAMGKSACIGIIDGSTAFSNGTSFASPIMAGAAACLWQANPGKNWKEVRDAILRSASRYHHPDSNYGFGIPDMILADDLLRSVTKRNTSGTNSLSYFPNPCKNELYLVFRVDDDQEVEI